MSNSATETIFATFNERGLLELHLDNNMPHPFVRQPALRELFGPVAKWIGHTITMNPPGGDKWNSVVQDLLTHQLSELFAHRVEIQFFERPIKKRSFDV